MFLSSTPTVLTLVCDRILLFNPVTRVAAEVLKDVFVYPNGLEVTPDGTRLLIAESGRAKITR